MLGLEIVLVILSITCCYLIYKLLVLKQKNKKLKLYEDITKNVLNSDPKTRKKIEDLCNAYKEHKVINDKIVNPRYLAQVDLILDEVKFINTIYSIEPYEEQRRKSAIENTIQKSEIVEAVKELQEESTSDKKGRKQTRGESE